MLGRAAATGQDLRGPVVDVLFSAIGVASVVPGTGEMLKAARIADKAAEGAGASKKIIWPPNRGFEGESARATLIPGAKVDRYGSEKGTFVAPAGTPFPQRSLPDGHESLPLKSYEVVRPIEVDAGLSAPWFGKPGGGKQFELPDTVSNLLKSGHLRQLD